jgi:hypothetical protein
VEILRKHQRGATIKVSKAVIFIRRASSGYRYYLDPFRSKRVGGGLAGQMGYSAVWKLTVGLSWPSLLPAGSKPRLAGNGTLLSSGISSAD